MSLVVAAGSDVARRVIPDSTGAVLLLLGILVRWPQGPAGLMLSLGIAAALFALLTLLHALHLLGGGDVKLLAALSSGFAPAVVPGLLTSVILAGGLVSIAYVGLRTLPRPDKATAKAGLLRRVYAVERWRILRRAPIPYGVAIAAGGIWTLLRM